LLLLLTDGKLSAIALSKERFIVKPKYRDRRKLKGRGQRAEGRRQKAEGRRQRAEGRRQRAEGRR
jgi:U3 small nucleolar ribonucleoprotein component